eukprot:COSAG01_NODE_12727_length_1693_cov_1.609159_2_plen_205_part_00
MTWKISGGPGSSWTKRHTFLARGSKPDGGYWSPHSVNGSWLVLFRGSASDAKARAVHAEWADTIVHGNSPPYPAKYWSARTDSFPYKVEWTGPEYIFERLGRGKAKACRSHPQYRYGFEDHAPRTTVTEGPGSDVSGRVLFETGQLEAGQTYHFCWVRSCCWFYPSACPLSAFLGPTPLSLMVSAELSKMDCAPGRKQPGADEQ